MPSWTSGTASVPLILALACFLLAPALASADAGNFEFRILGADEKPVGDAVVSLVPKGGAPARRPEGSPAPKARMDQIDRQFKPHVLAVETGTVVDFPNSDQIRHSIYSFSAPRVFEVKLYRGLEAPPVTFAEPGLVVLGCHIHDDMLGFIYALDTPYAEVSHGDGSGTITDVPSGLYTLEVRHPRVDQSILTRIEVELPLTGPLSVALDESPPPRETRSEDQEDPEPYMYDEDEW